MCIHLTLDWITAEQCRKLRFWWERNPLMGVMLIANDIEKTGEGMEILGIRAPQLPRERRGHRDILVVI